MLLEIAAKGWNSLGHWLLNLWAAELGIYYSNVYVKISFASLNILASVDIAAIIKKFYSSRAFIMFIKIWHHRTTLRENMVTKLIF